MSKTSKIESLIQFTQFVSLFIILVGIFLGSMYIFEANLFLSAIISFGLVAILYYFIDIMIAARMDTKKNGLNLGMKMLWIIFIVTAIPVNLLIMHTFNIEISEKAEIQRIGKAKIETLRKLKVDYRTAYESYLKEKRGSLISDIDMCHAGLLSVPDAARKNNVKEDLINNIDQSSLITITSGVDSSYIKFERMKFLREDTAIFGNTETYLNRKNDIITGWQRFALNEALSDLDKYLPLTYSKLNQFLESKAGKTLVYNKAEAEMKTNINKPMDLLLLRFGIVHLILLILVNALLLTPYFIAPKKVYKAPKKDGGTIGDVKTY
jgi:hypothetical protein